MFQTDQEFVVRATSYFFDGIVGDVTVCRAKMLSHPLKQMPADYPLWVTGDVEGTRNALRSARSRVHQAHSAPHPSQMDCCSEPSGASADHDAIIGVPADD